MMLFFALCGALLLGYHSLSESAFAIAGGIILFLVELDMLSAKRQQLKRAETKGGGNAGKAGSDEPGTNNLIFYPLAISVLAGPCAIMSIIVVNAVFAGALASTLTSYTALPAMMVTTGTILYLTVLT